MVRQLLITLFFISSAVIISWQFEAVLVKMIGIGITGWVVGTFLLRIIIILLLAIGLHALFKLFIKTKKIKKWVTLCIALLPGFGLSFAFFPIWDIDYGDYSDEVIMDDVSFLEGYTVEPFIFNNEPKVLAFLDLGCNHCEDVCRKLAANQTNGQEIETHLFFRGTEEDINHFLKKNNGMNLNHHRVTAEHIFIQYAGFGFPSVFLINENGDTEKHWTGSRLNYSGLDFILSKEQP